LNKGESLERIAAVALKEVKEIRRSRLFLLLAHFVPLALFFVFGFGLSLDVEHTPTAVLDLDRTHLSRNFINDFVQTKYFRLVKRVENRREINYLLEKGEIRLGIVIPPQFQRRIYQERSSPVQFLIDGTYPYRGTVIKSYTEAVVSSFNGWLISNWLSRKGMQNIELHPILLDVRFLYNQALISSYSVVPGLLVVVLMMGPAIMAAIAMVKEKDYGTIYNIYSSPIAKWEFLLGKLVPYYILNIINILVLFIVSITLFKVPFKGSFLLFLTGSFLYIFTTTGMGLLVSTFTRSMVAAQVVTIIITVIPSFLYSGLLMPVSNLGREGEIEAHIFPSMYYMKIVQGTYSKVTGFKEMGIDYLIIVAYGLALLIFGMILFRKREG
jgi:ABC-2 type transport system permease protein/ribosome-dependent ATPase